MAITVIILDAGGLKNNDKIIVIMKTNEYVYDIYIYYIEILKTTNSSRLIRNTI